MRCLYPRCEHGRVVEQGECHDCLRAENERLKDELHAKSFALDVTGRDKDILKRREVELRAEVERLTRERDEALAAPDANWYVVAQNLRSSVEDSKTRAEKAERERDEARDIYRETEERLARERTAHDKTEDERDALKAALTTEARIALDYQSQRDEEAALRDRLAARVKVLEEALREISELYANPASSVARAALAAKEET